MLAATRPHSGALNQYVYGVHSVLSAICFRQRIIHKLYIKSDLSEEKGSHEILSNWKKRIENAASEAEIPVVQTSNAHLSKMVNGRPHQGFVLEASQIPVKAINRRTVFDLFDTKSLGLQNPSTNMVNRHVRPLILLIDHLTDVMNFGSIIRSAVFFGASALLFSPPPCVGPSPLISKLSVGALECLPLYRLTDVPHDLKLLSSAGFLLVGTAGNTGCEALNRSPVPTWLLTGDQIGVQDGINPKPLILALGSESRGLSEEVLRACHLQLRIVGSQESIVYPNDDRDSLPSSLNVAVAAGILLYQLTYLRHGPDATKSCFYFQ
ncbi:rRNA methyltransferase 1 mitochondrial [Fasciola hepatica]|uniref:rRNA methyltransferase 1, mitochondrial n=1 Tax=Fasciola hepatica TaxID=6192 RepID=A0A4E0QWW0_FASHE|nr:rRNA methyltransferase 1 mitochondrial [Fasciola hepatica]